MFHLFHLFHFISVSLLLNQFNDKAGAESAAALSRTVSTTELSAKHLKTPPKFQVSDPRLLLPPSIFQFMFVPKLFSILKSIKWGQFRVLPMQKTALL